MVEEKTSECPPAPRTSGNRISGTSVNLSVYGSANGMDVPEAEYAALHRNENNPIRKIRSSVNLFEGIPDPDDECPPLFRDSHTGAGGSDEGGCGHHRSNHHHHNHHRTATPVNIETLLKKQITRLVAVRYFLDRPGVGIQNSAARFWFNPPKICKPKHLQKFLDEQGIALDGLLVEVYLDQVESYMMLDACEACMLEWDFTDTTTKDPGVLNIRLTDLEEAKLEEENSGELVPLPPQAHSKFAKPATAAAAAPDKLAEPVYANVTPAGLFSFSMMVGLEAAAITGKLIPGSVNESYVLKWAPYMFFVGGLMQIIVAIFQVLRNNVYGATAFLGFGTFWFSNGFMTILETYFAVESSPADELLYEVDKWGFFIRLMFIFAFCCALEIQTFAMNKLSSTLIGLLSLKVFAQAFTGWSAIAMWLQFVFGWLTSLMAFYVFLVEFTNSIYHKEVFKVHRWSEKQSPEEVFGAPGRHGTLHSKGARLRQAKYPNIRKLREAPVTLDDATLRANDDILNT